MNNFSWGILGCICGVLLEFALNLLFTGRAWPPYPNPSPTIALVFAGIAAGMLGSSFSKLVRAWDEFSDHGTYFSICLNFGFWATWGIEPYWHTDVPGTLLLTQMLMLGVGFSMTGSAPDATRRPTSSALMRAPSTPRHASLHALLALLAFLSACVDLPPASRDSSRASTDAPRSVRDVTERLADAPLLPVEPPSTPPPLAELPSLPPPPTSILDGDPLGLPPSAWRRAHGVLSAGAPAALALSPGDAPRDILRRVAAQPIADALLDIHAIDPIHAILTLAAPLPDLDATRRALASLAERPPLEALLAGAGWGIEVGRLSLPAADPLALLDALGERLPGEGLDPFEAPDSCERCALWVDATRGVLLEAREDDVLVFAATAVCDLDATPRRRLAAVLLAMLRDSRLAPPLHPTPALVAWLDPDATADALWLSPGRWRRAADARRRRAQAIALADEPPSRAPWVFSQTAVALDRIHQRARVRRPALQDLTWLRDRHSTALPWIVATLTPRALEGPSEACALPALAAPQTTTLDLALCPPLLAPHPTLAALRGDAWIPHLADPSALLSSALGDLLGVHLHATGGVRLALDDGRGAPDALRGGLALISTSAAEASLPTLRVVVWQAVARLSGRSLRWSWRAANGDAPMTLLIGLGLDPRDHFAPTHESIPVARLRLPESAPLSAARDGAALFFTAGDAPSEAARRAAHLYRPLSPSPPSPGPAAIICRAALSTIALADAHPITHDHLPTRASIIERVPSARRALLARERLQRCAAWSPDVAMASSSGVTRPLATVAWGERARGDLEASARALGALCDAGEPVGCLWLAQWPRRALPLASLPASPFVGQDIEPPPLESRILLDDAGVLWMDDRRVCTPTPRAPCAPRPLPSTPRGAVTLEVPAAVPWSELRPLLRALSAAGASPVHAIARDVEGVRHRVLLPLPQSTAAPHPVEGPGPTCANGKRRAPTPAPIDAFFVRQTPSPDVARCALHARLQSGPRLALFSLDDPTMGAIIQVASAEDWPELVKLVVMERPTLRRCSLSLEVGPQTPWTDVVAAIDALSHPRAAPAPDHPLASSPEVLTVPLGGRRGAPTQTTLLDAPLFGAFEVQL